MESTNRSARDIRVFVLRGRLYSGVPALLVLELNARLGGIQSSFSSPFLKA